MYKKYLFGGIMLLLLLVISSCSNDNDYEIPSGIKSASNDCLKRSLGPNVVGGTIEFAYAMALPKGGGHWIEAKVEATYAGADGTMLENNSYHTEGGYDKGVKIGDPCVQSGKTTSVKFTVDTISATLRYYYVVPEEARGKEVSFVFSATDSNGNTVHYDMGPYQISNVDMALDIKLKNRDCFSIKEMRVLSKDEAEANPDLVDFIYTFQVVRGVTFNHAFISPTEANQKTYLDGVSLPAGMSNQTLMRRTYGSCDQQLARDENAVFVDDMDFKNITFTDTQDFVINIIAKGGAWMETADKKYRAYVYVNTATTNRAGMTISIKRLQMN